MRATAWLWTLVLLLIAAQAAAQVSSTTLQWTAPGDDGDVGRATQFDGRYSTTRPDTLSGMATWWASSSQIPGLPAPLIAGSIQSVTISPAGGFLSGVTYYFVLRTADEVPNWSDYSNVAWRLFPDIVPPAAILDLR